jgi:CubicO group peptidase (beta-lactamase class C family)
MNYFLALVIWAVLSLGTAAQSLYFPPKTGTTWDTLSPQSLNWCPNEISQLYTYLDSIDTKAFIVLKDGRIVLEKYFDSHNVNTIWPWNSAGKTITSFLVGIAKQSGALHLNDTTSKYLGPGWTSCTSGQEDQIRVWNQLTMTTGLDDNVADKYCTLDTCLLFKAPAGTRWAYHNAPYTLLDEVINTATGQSLNAYVLNKLKVPTGITGSFVSAGYNNVYVSNARSMARFGLLILNRGIWNGDTLLSDSTYEYSMRNSSQSINPSYGYLWWLNGKSSYRLPSSQFTFSGWLNPNAPADMFAAWGKDGQIINIVPSQNLVWIRMGNAPDGSPIPNLLNNRIWNYLNRLNCATINLDEQPRSQFQISPNPTFGHFSLTARDEVSDVALLNHLNQVVKQWYRPDLSEAFSIEGLSSGVYFVRLTLANGDVRYARLIKND